MKTPYQISRLASIFVIGSLSWSATYAGIINGFDVTGESLSTTGLTSGNFTQVFNTYTALDDENVSLSGTLAARANSGTARLRGQIRINGNIVGGIAEDELTPVFSNLAFSGAYSLQAGDELQVFLQDQSGDILLAGSGFSNLNITSSNNFNSSAAVPEPSTFAFLAAVGAMFGIRIRRRRAESAGDPSHEPLCECGAFR